MTKTKRIIPIILGVLVVILGVWLAFNRFYIDYLWFGELDYLSVFFKEVTTKVKIVVPLALIIFIGVYFYLKFLSALFVRFLGAQNAPEHKTERRVRFIASLVIGIGAAIYFANSLWSLLLAFLNSSDTGTVDPLFGLDVSFYLFALPTIRMAYSFIFRCFAGVVVLTVVFTVYILFLKKDFRISSEGMNAVRDEAKSLFRQILELASIEIGIFLGIFFLLLAGDFFITRWEMVYGGTGMVYGAGAADMAVKMKVIYLSIALCLIFAVTSVVAGVRHKYKLMVAGPLIIVLVSVGGAVVQGVYEKAVVVPNQYTQEAPFIANNIKSTRQSFGFDSAEIKEFSPTQEITAEDLRENENTVENIPINDHSPTKDMYNSLQGIRNYYRFYDVDVDRYNIDGHYTQVFVSSREMDNDALPEDARTWVNEHLKYTHGFGITMSPVNKTNSSGQPDLLIKDIPPNSASDDLKVTEPRIYFGEADYKYAVVGAKSPEFDYPQGDDNKENYYEGTAGIPLNFLNRLAFALNTGSPEMLLTSEITDESKILIHRNVMDRVKKVASFLDYDDQPYIVLSEGRLYWIINGYTKSDRYPYAQPYDEVGNNYVRNPVKIVVDAYNGDVDIYQVEDEPIINTYAQIFPDLIKDVEEMPAGIREHIRYSKTLFNIQADVYSTYHMVNPQVFYNREDQWQTAHQFFGESKEKVDVDPAYIIMKLPDRETEFMLTNAYTPKNKDNMVAWLAGVSDGDDYGKLIVYQFPKQEMIYGPMQIEQRIDQDTTIAPQLTLLSQQGSRVLRGNMQTIPIEDAIIYVEPIYLQASSGGNNLPEAKKVIVSYQNRIIMADTLADGLDQIFGGGGDAAANPEAGQSSPASGTSTATIKDLTKQANDQYNAAVEAQKAGNWAEYGKQLEALQKTLNELDKLSNK